MRGLVFDGALRRLVVPALIHIASRGRVSGPAPARLRTLPSPELPSPQWARLRPVATGVCGSDVIQMTLQADRDNPLRALVAFPHVMGHEATAVVLEPPASPSPGAPPVRSGDLVAINPALGCEVGGRSLCAPCGDGDLTQCEHAGEDFPGHTGGGMHLGNTPGLPGGFGTEMVVHGARLHPLPAGLGCGPAVLADPLAVAIHAVERAGITPDTRFVLVLGAGTIGLCTAAVLRAVHPQVTPLVTAMWPHLVDEVQRLGAQPIPVGHGAAVTAVQQRTGGRLMEPPGGKPWLLGGGVPRVIDTIASASTSELALAAAASRAIVVEVGVHRPSRTESTLRYYKEVEVRGANAYGRLRSGRPGMEVALEMLADGRVPGDRWVTHRFSLDDWRKAFAAAAQPQRSGAIKVSIWPATEEMGR